MGEQESPTTEFDESSGNRWTCQTCDADDAEDHSRPYADFAHVRRQLRQRRREQRLDRIGANSIDDYKSVEAFYVGNPNPSKHHNADAGHEWNQRIERAKELVCDNGGNETPCNAYSIHRNQEVERLCCVKADDIFSKNCDLKRLSANASDQWKETYIVVGEVHTPKRQEDPHGKERIRHLFESAPFNEGALLSGGDPWPRQQQDDDGVEDLHKAHDPSRPWESDSGGQLTRDLGLTLVALQLEVKMNRD